MELQRSFFLLCLYILFPQHKNTFCMKGDEDIKEKNEIQQPLERKFSFIKDVHIQTPEKKQAQDQLNTYLFFQLVIDSIRKRTLPDNIKILSNLSLFSNEMKNDVNEIFKLQYKEMKQKIVLRGTESSTEEFLDVDWEDEFNKNLLLKIVEKKIIFSGYPKSNELTTEINNLSTTDEKLAIFNAFNQGSLPLKRLYLLCTRQHGKIREALFQHTLHETQKDIKRKSPMLSFIVISAILWNGHRRLPPKVQEVLKYIYQLFALKIIDFMRIPDF